MCGIVVQARFRAGLLLPAAPSAPLSQAPRLPSSPRCQCRRTVNSPQHPLLPPDTLPVLEEHVHVRQERIETGAVRVRIAPEESVQPVRLEGWSETYEVQRVPKDEPVDERKPPWQDGEVLVVPVYEEEVILQRRWVLKEELRLLKRREPLVETQNVVLRKDVAHIERRDGNGSWTAADDDTPLSRAAAPASPDSPGER